MTAQLSLPLCVCGNPACGIPYGTCHCGCGENAGFYKGKLCRCVFGHKTRRRPQKIDAIPFKIDGAYCRLIPLTQGQYAIVNAEDYEWLMEWEWWAQYNPKSHNFYAVRKQRLSKGKFTRLHMHREIMGLENSDPFEVDHIEPSRTLDNRRKNLRICTHSQNQMNSLKRRDSISQLKGVCHDRNKWQARIRINGKQVYLGQFLTEQEAHTAYVEAAVRLRGEFARTA